MFDTIIQLLENFAFVLVIVYIYAYVRKRFERYPFYLHAIFIGIIFSGIAILAMQRPIQIMEGVIIDVRIILIALSGFFGGPIAVGITACIIGAYRLYLGGIGMIPGVVSIVAAGVAGGIFYYLKHKFNSEKTALLTLGGIVASTALASTFLLPMTYRINAFRSFTIPVLILHPVGIYVYGMLIVSAQKKYLTEIQLLDLNSHLANLVKERTSQLEDVNKGLIEEIETRSGIENALKKAEKEAIEANKMKSDFLANMSHEIRTPLNAITGYTYLLGKTILNEKQKDFRDKLDSSASNLLSIVNDILDFSKIEAGKVDVVKAPVNLYQLINNLMDTVSFELLKKDLSLTLSMDEGIPEWVIGDESHFSQILLNIMSNAVKFTSEGGVKIDMSTTSVEGESECLLMIIKDTGIGVKAEDMLTIFNEFTQANMSINRQFGGTGLGLTITKKLVEAMHGELHFDSTYGEGSTVTIKMPLVKSHQQIRRFENIIHVVLLTQQKNKFKSLFDQLTKMDVAIKYIASIDQLRWEEDIDYIFVDWEESASDRPTLMRRIKEQVEEGVVIDMVTYGRNRKIQKHIENHEEARILYLPQSSEKIKKMMASSSNNELGHTLEQHHHMQSIKDKHILIVEDNSLNQDIERTIIEEKGAIVKIADHGGEAVDILKEEKFDLILMDIHMPVMGGYDAALAIRELKNGLNVPIIAMTADVQIGVEDRVKAAGMNDYIKKPINVMEVYKTLYKWL